MAYENKESKIQQLSFEYFTAELMRKRIKDKKIEKTLLFFTNLENNYTNLALLLSDQCDVKTTFEINLDECKVRKSYKGPILYQLQLSLSYLALADEDSYKQYRKKIINNYIETNYGLYNNIRIKVSKRENLLSEDGQMYQNKLLGEVFKMFGYK